jgi:hypothetical protein
MSIYDRIRAQKGDILHSGSAKAPTGSTADETKPADGKKPSIYDRVRKNFDPRKPPQTGTTN